jgi:23S rRNA (cytosine1962-C5)-methyltransferase
MSHPEVFLRKNEERRALKGHLWIFSNEIDSNRTPLDFFNPGDLVNIKASNGKSLGTAYVNPHALICARLLSKQQDLLCNDDFFLRRISAAFNLRQRLYERPYYRLIYGESDALPGLVVDCFGDVLSVQITTAGMERRKEKILSVLTELFRPTGIILKNDNSQRQLEGLALVDETIGQIPQPLMIEENGARFKIDIFGGQKTGWFYDHRQSRRLLKRFVKGQRVLDLFSYTGAWAIPSALSGATSVVCVDASESALRLAKENAQINQVEDKISCVRSDVFEYLKQAKQHDQKFDIIVLDPPALIKRKKDFKQGYEAYRRLNYLALKVLDKNGILVSASCSYHLSSENLQDILRSAGREAGRRFVYIAAGGQDSDHPVEPTMPETSYLKTFFCAVSNEL